MGLVGRRELTLLRPQVRAGLGMELALLRPQVRVSLGCLLSGVERLSLRAKVLALLECFRPVMYLDPRKQARRWRSVSVIWMLPVLGSRPAWRKCGRSA